MEIPLPFYGVLLYVRRSEQLWQSRLLDKDTVLEAWVDEARSRVVEV
jgi:hypothetical protein